MKMRMTKRMTKRVGKGERRREDNGRKMRTRDAKKERFKNQRE